MARDWNNCSHTSNIVLEGLVNLNPLLTLKYLLPSQLILVLAPSYSLLLRSKYLFTPHESEVQTPIQYVMLHLQSAWHSFAVLQKPCRPKSPLLCVNRSSIWCGFRASTTAIQYSVNIALKLQARYFH